MKKINKKEFEKIYEAHKNWLSGQNNGKQLKLVNCSFTKDCLTNINLYNSIFENCDFSNCDLTNTKFENSIIQKCNFIKAKYLSINAFSFSKLYGTELPFSYSQKIEIANDYCSKYKIISLLYFIICVYYILFAFSTPYSDFFLESKINIPNPFFNLTTSVSHSVFLCFGITVVFILDKLLYPLTLETIAMIRNLPVTFPNGESISTVLSKYFLFRWIIIYQLDYRGKLPIDNISPKNLDKNILKNDYITITNNAIAVDRFIGFVCLYLFFSRILHIYSYEFPLFNLNENDLQMVLGIFFISSINRSGNEINTVTLFLLIITHAVFIDFRGINAFVVDILHYNKPIWNLTLLLAFISIVSYYITPKVTKMNSALPIYIVIATIYFSSPYLSNISLEDVSFSEWNGVCEKEQIDKYTNKRFIGGNLRNLKASNVNFNNSNFSNANLQNADFRCSNFSNAILKGADVKGADFRYATGIQDSICSTLNYKDAKLSFTPNCKKILLKG